MKKIVLSLIALAISAFALDINTATAEEFVKVKGIGDKIVAVIKAEVE